MPEITKEALMRADQSFNRVRNLVQAQMDVLENTKFVEDETENDRWLLYKQAFAGGVILDEVIDTRRVSFGYGFDRPDSPSASAIFHDADEQHATCLEGLYIPNPTDISIRSMGNLQDRMEGNSPRFAGEMSFTFKLTGVHVNSNMSAEDREYAYWVPTEEREFTHYKAYLPGLEWRLPTQDEIEAFSDEPDPVHLARVRVNVVNQANTENT